MENTYAITLKSIKKTFPGVVALDDINFSLRFGEVRALLGKNGAGKSTLIRIACGLEQPDEGIIEVAHEKVHLRNPREANERGIEIVSQELNVFPFLSVAENIAVGNWPKKGNVIDKQEMNQLAVDTLKRLEIEINPKEIVWNLSPAQQQIIEIARALSRNPAVLLLDEPTSSLALPEVNALLKTVKNIASQGVGIIYVSHRLSEISEVADSVTILRDGKLVITAPIYELSDKAIINHMVGESIEFQKMEYSNFDSKSLVLKVKNLSITNKIDNISFDLHKGEVLGLAGLLGSGRSEILRTIAGFNKVQKGTIEIISSNDKEFRQNVRHMIKNGVALSPEDRREEGVFPFMGVDENISIAQWHDMSKFGRLSWKKVREMASDLIGRLSIVTPKIDTPIMNLSGGNQQKAIIGRWIDIANHVLLLDEPTRGIDVEAKNQIYEIIRNTSDQGIGVIVVTSELEELLWCCHSIIFLWNGKASRKYLISELDIEKINSFANGGFNE